MMEFLATCFVILHISGTLIFILNVFISVELGDRIVDDTYIHDVTKINT